MNYNLDLDQVSFKSSCTTIFKFMHFKQYLCTQDLIFILKVEIQQETGKSIISTCIISVKHSLLGL